MALLAQIDHLRAHTGWYQKAHLDTEPLVQTLLQRATDKQAAMTEQKCKKQAHEKLHVKPHNEITWLAEDA